MATHFQEAQLSKFGRLIKYAVRWLFAGDLSDRVADEDVDADPLAPKAKKRVNKLPETDLAVIIVDNLTYYQGWVSEDKFAERLKLGAKQVRKMLQFLQRQGFVVREHRRERKKGATVESVADFEEPAEGQARTASYVSIDYPLFFDLLRLRLYLVKKQMTDKIDDGQFLEQYACCSPDGAQEVCGKKYNSFDINYLEFDEGGFMRCSTCDTGIVAPDDELSRTEPNGKLRISRKRWRRDSAKRQKKALLETLTPLEAMISALEGVDPPDFGSFTDWTQARQEQRQAGKAPGSNTGARGGGRKGHLDYGIDGPVKETELHIDDDKNEEQAAPTEGVALDTGPKKDARESLPFFMQKGIGAAEASSSAAPDAAASADTSQADKERYEAFKRQFEAQVAALRATQTVGAAKVEPKDEVKAEVKEDDDRDAKRVKLEDGTYAAADADDKEPVPNDDIEWEEEPEGAGAAAAPDAQAPATNGNEDDDMEWEDV